ncbi:hypothetical protein Vretimale_13233 [Volvox reticuliferus]|uniref:Uncharacterized protein n=1 Tax=Volvox reticuliferus TaxID=1737510 RepID=A0A8J4CSF5_9CHLO|nr:hypothetical protein Vretifemale_14127 [Volvox reticuliferus]GIM09324.1 hypothetical protein Vretimale_13233 [Volvox reticuliferus]
MLRMRRTVVIPERHWGRVTAMPVMPRIRAGRGSPTAMQLSLPPVLPVLLPPLLLLVLLPPVFFILRVLRSPMHPAGGFLGGRQLSSLPVPVTMQSLLQMQMVLERVAVGALPLQGGGTAAAGVDERVA